MSEAPATQPVALTARVTRDERTAARTVEGRSMVVVIDRNQLHTLNPTGSFLWELCDGRTVAELAELLAERYQVDAAQAQQDVVAFVQSLVAVKALRVEES